MKTLWKYFWMTVLWLAGGVLLIVAFIWLIAAFYNATDIVLRVGLLLSTLALVANLIALFFTRRSLQKTEEGLQLTRAIQRPFVSFSGPIRILKKANSIILEFKVQNFGNFPASDIKEYFQFFSEDENITEDNISAKYPPVISRWSLDKHSYTMTIFPHDFLWLTCNFELKQKNQAELWRDIQNGKVKVRLQIIYNELSKKHSTNQAMKLSMLEGKQELLGTPIAPYKWD
jgi:hypothetical protein